MTETLHYTAAADVYGLATSAFNYMTTAAQLMAGVDTSPVQMLAINVGSVNDAPSFALSTISVSSLLKMLEPKPSPE